MHIWFSHFKKLNSSKHVTFPAESEVRYVQATVVCSSPFWLCSTYSRTLHIDFPSNWSQSSQREWQRRTPPFLYNLSHQKRSRVIFLVQLQHNTSRMFPTLFFCPAFWSNLLCALNCWREYYRGSLTDYFRSTSYYGYKPYELKLNILPFSPLPF